MKVLMINGSPNANGCTFTALSEVSKILNENGIDSDKYHSTGKQRYSRLHWLRQMRRVKKMRLQRCR